MLRVADNVQVRTLYTNNRRVFVWISIARRRLSPSADFRELFNHATSDRRAMSQSESALFQFYSRNCHGALNCKRLNEVDSRITDKILLIYKKYIHKYPRMSKPEGYKGRRPPMPPQHPPPRKCSDVRFIPVNVELKLASCIRTSVGLYDRHFSDMRNKMYKFTVEFSCCSQNNECKQFLWPVSLSLYRQATTVHSMSNHKEKRGSHQRDVGTKGIQLHTANVRRPRISHQPISCGSICRPI